MPKRLRKDSGSSGSSISTVLGSPASSDMAPPPAKYTQTTEPPAAAIMECLLPPHSPISFTTYAAYDVHYAQDHTNRCSECHKNFPSEHFLDLHIGENHDPLNEALREKGEKTYFCFVEDCDRACSTPQKRRMHLIDKHLFPKNYDFLVVNTGMDKRSSMLRSHRRHGSAASRAVPRRSSIHQPADASNSESSSKLIMEAQAVQAATVDSETQKPQSRSKTKPDQDEVDALADSLSALKFVPPSVRFGRGGRRGGLAKR